MMDDTAHKVTILYLIKGFTLKKSNIALPKKIDKKYMPASKELVNCIIEMICLLTDTSCE